MKHRTMHPALAVTLAAGVLLASESCATVSPPPAPRGGVAEPDMLTGTCREVDEGARTLDVITGVGFALRVVRFQVHPACEVAIAGSSARVEDLRPGEIVRVRFRKGREGDVAVRVETVAVDGTGSAR